MTLVLPGLFALMLHFIAVAVGPPVTRLGGVVRVWTITVMRQLLITTGRVRTPQDVLP